MKMQTITRLIAGIAIVLGAATPLCVHAQAAWPTQSLRLIVGYPAGSTPDVQARLIAEPLSKALGQPIIVDNKPGAGGTIGVDLVVKARDGHTIGVTGNGPLTTAKQLYAKLPYDPAIDVRPIGTIAEAPLVLVTRGALPVDSVAAFIAYAKHATPPISYGSAGNGSGAHLTMELLRTELKFEALHVAYPGFPQVTTALMGDQIDASTMVPSSALAQADSGKLKILAVTSLKRVPFLKTTPSIAEVTTLKSFNAVVWNGVFAPKGFPDAAANRLSSEVQKIVSSPEFQAKMTAQGWVAQAGSGADLAERMKKDGALWSDVIKSVNIQLD
jgi:tripartite-type tricarboxylate transporter receptor subunit TctC